MRSLVWRAPCHGTVVAQVRCVVTQNASLLLSPPGRGHGMTVAPGQSFPLGATVVDGGVNFCVFSREASAIELLLFDGACDAEPARDLPISTDDR
jgi:hypothetical protein